eukprot:364974-Chlamydomonas_euryale.AAC.3
MQIFAVSKHRISTGSRLWVPLPPSSSSSSSKPSKGRIYIAPVWRQRDMHEETSCRRREGGRRDAGKV